MHSAPSALLAAAAAMAAVAGAPGARPAEVAVDSSPADGRALRDADQALARAVGQRDRAAFESLLTDDAYFAGGGEPLKGRAAVVKGWASFFEPGGPRMSWAPELSEISSSGDLGYTVGHYRFESRDAAGRKVEREGRYVTVWRSAGDGAFRVVVDAPLVPPAEDGTPAATRNPERTLSSRDGDLVVEAGTWQARDGAARGSYVDIRRRTREGALAPALETVVQAGATRE
jgi:ketosteroid isomerase-like protein